MIERVELEKEKEVVPVRTAHRLPLLRWHHPHAHVAPSLRNLAAAQRVGLLRRLGPDVDARDGRATKVGVGLARGRVGLDLVLDLGRDRRQRRRKPLPQRREGKPRPKVETEPSREAQRRRSLGRDRRLSFSCSRGRPQLPDKGTCLRLSRSAESELAAALGQERHALRREHSAVTLYVLFEA